MFGPGISALMMMVTQIAGFIVYAVPFVIGAFIAYWLVCLAVRRVRRGMGR